MSLHDDLYKTIFTNFDISKLSPYLYEVKHKNLLEMIYTSLNTLNPTLHYKSSHIKIPTPQMISYLLELIDGTLAISEKSDIYIISNMTELYSLKGHFKLISGIVELKQRILVSSSYDGTIRLWDGKSGYVCTGVIKISNSDIIHTMIGVDSSTILLASSLKLYRVNSERTPEEFPIGYDIIYLRLLSNGHIACGTKEHVVLVIDSDITLVKILYGHSWYVNNVIQLKDGRLLSTSAENTVIVWRGYEEEFRQKLSFTLHAIKELRNGEIVISTGFGVVVKFNILKGRIVKDFTISLNDKVNFMIQLRDGRLLTGGDSIIIWN
jgi:WD40 repeat protein